MKAGGDGLRLKGWSVVPSTSISPELPLERANVWTVGVRDATSTGNEESSWAQMVPDMLWA